MKLRRALAKKWRDHRPSYGGIYETFYYSEFQCELTETLGGADLFLDKVLHNLVNLTVYGPSSHRDIVEAVSKRAQQSFPIDSLAPELGATRLYRGWVGFQVAGEILNSVTRNYRGFGWWFSDRGLNIGPVPVELPDPFDELVGSMIVEVRRSLASARIGRDKYLEIARRLDELNFKVAEILTAEDRKLLALHNQKHPRNTIKTFEKALAIKQVSLGWLPRSIKKRMYRSAQKYSDRQR